MKIRHYPAAGAPFDVQCRCEVRLVQREDVVALPRPIIDTPGYKLIEVVGGAPFAIFVGER